MSLTVLTGPPQNSLTDEKWVKDFLSLGGERIICGGTTAAIAGRYLKQDVEISLEGPSTGLPPLGFLGTIPVTEGIITLEGVVTLLSGKAGEPLVPIEKILESVQILPDESGAKTLAEALLNHDEVIFLLGIGRKREELVMKLESQLKALGKRTVIRKK